MYVNARTLLVGKMFVLRYDASYFPRKWMLKRDDDDDDTPALHSAPRIRMHARPDVRVRLSMRVYTCGKCTLSAVRETDSPALLKVSLFRWLGQHVVSYWLSARPVHPDNTRRFTNLPHSSTTGWSKLCAPRSAEFRRRRRRHRLWTAYSLGRPIVLDFPMHFEGRNNPSTWRITPIGYFCTRFFLRFQSITPWFSETNDLKFYARKMHVIVYQKRHNSKNMIFLIIIMNELSIIL